MDNKNYVANYNKVYCGGLSLHLGGGESLQAFEMVPRCLRKGEESASRKKVYVGSSSSDYGVSAHEIDTFGLFL